MNVRLRLCSGSTGETSLCHNHPSAPSGLDHLSLYPGLARPGLRSRAAIRLSGRLVPTSYREVRLQTQTRDARAYIFLVLGQPLLRDESSCFG